MRILLTAFVAGYAGHIINVHHSLLPRYPGLHTHRQALVKGDAEHGPSVYCVTDELDSGSVVLHEQMPVFAGDDEKTTRAMGKNPGTCYLSLGRRLAAGRSANAAR